jgi:hypothetical protein
MNLLIHTVKYNRTFDIHDFAQFLGVGNPVLIVLVGKIFLEFALLGMGLPDIQVPKLGVIVFLGDFLDGGHLPAVGRSCYGAKDQDDILLADSVGEAKPLTLISLEIDFGGPRSQSHCAIPVLVALSDLRVQAYLDQLRQVAVHEADPGFGRHFVIVGTG